jgi:hypothetical protein
VSVHVYIYITVKNACLLIHSGIQRNLESPSFDPISGLLGFWTSFIVLYSEEHNFSESGSVSVFGRGGGRYLLCWVR